METPPRTRRGGRPIAPSRKILTVVACAFAILAALPVGYGTGASIEAEAGDGDLRRAALSQAGRNLILTVRTASPVGLGRLAPQPDGGRGTVPYLCLELRRLGRRGARRLCLGGRRNRHSRVGVELLNAGGEVVRRATVPARLRRHGARKLALALQPAAAGLKPHRYRWRVLENRRGCSQASCETTLPRRGSRVFRLRPVRPVGCTGGGAGTVRNGPRDRKVVALTFDDGPSSYTEAFLDVLRRERAHATFFEIGQEVPGRGATLRRILREGHEIANHTTHHGSYPGYWDLAETNALIRGATHFQPCLFRPPGGALDSAVVDAAARAGMKTVLWDVDPADWTSPGSGAVYSRVVGAVGPGSIVLMHDGGGNRGGTLAALPRIVETLRGRGYGFATVSELLGNRLLYRPYG